MVRKKLYLFPPVSKGYEFALKCLTYDLLQVCHNHASLFTLYTLRLLKYPHTNYKC